MEDTTKENNKQTDQGNKSSVVNIVTFLGLYIVPIVLMTIFAVNLLTQWLPLKTSEIGSNRWISITSVQLISEEILRDHFAAVIGLPMAGFFSLWVVTILRSKSGPIEFKALGFSFRGASGPVVLWVLCFIAIAFAIKLLW